MWLPWPNMTFSKHPMYWTLMVRYIIHLSVVFFHFHHVDGQPPLVSPWRSHYLHYVCFSARQRNYYSDKTPCLRFREQHFKAHTQTRALAHARLIKPTYAVIVGCSSAAANELGCFQKGTKLRQVQAMTYNEWHTMKTWLTELIVWSKTETKLHKATYALAQWRRLARQGKGKEDKFICTAHFITR